MNSGSLGEKIAEKYLVGKGFTVMERNYREPWGEIDLILKRDQKYTFVEVKTVEVEEENWKMKAENNRPHERVTAKKLVKMRKVVGTYLQEKGLSEKPWSFLVCGIYLDMNKKRAKVSCVTEPL